LGAAGWAARPDSLDPLAASEIPLLVVRGDEDELSTPPDAEAMLEVSPLARLEVLTGSGHIRALGVSGAFDAVIRAFVQGLGQWSVSSLFDYLLESLAGAGDFGEDRLSGGPDEGLGVVVVLGG
jgi:hypothetical protein